MPINGTRPVVLMENLEVITFEITFLDLEECWKIAKVAEVMRFCIFLHHFNTFLPPFPTSGMPF